MADTTGLQPDFAADILKLIAASNGQIWINSGYRSDERQAQLYQAAVQKYGPAEAGNWVAPPGHSNHNRGLAVDLGGNLTLAHQLAARFGMTFPMGWEPWHIEPIGIRGTYGVNDPQAYTNPPAGSNATAGDTPIHTAMSIFTQLLQGKSAAEIDAALGNTVQGEDTAATGSPTGTASTTGAPSSSIDVGQGAVDPKQLYQWLRQAGLDPLHAAAGVAIAGRESNYTPSAHNDNPATGDNSYGLFQVNLIGGMHSEFSPQDLTTAAGSVNAFAKLVGQSGLQPWGGYKGMPWYHGAENYLDTAVAASGGQVTREQLMGLGN